MTWGPLFKTWAGWLRATAFASGVTGVAGLGAYDKAQESFKPPPADPGILDICLWAFSGGDPAARIAAVIAALGAVASFYQLFGPKPAGEKLVRKLFGDARRHQNDSFKAADERAGGRHEHVLELVRRDKHDQALDDLARGDPALVARYDQVRAAVAAKGGVASDQVVANAAVTAERLATSDDPAEQAIARLVSDGQFRDAARARATLAEAQLAKAAKPAAEALREAGRLALPFSPAEALEYFARAVDLDPDHVWAWIELGRLRRQYGSLADARACFGSALQRVTDERDRGVLHNEFGNVLLAEGQLADACSEYEAFLAIADRLATHAPGNAEWQRDLSVSYEKLGDVEVAAGDLGKARERFEASLAIADRLATREPGNAEWQRDLSVSYEKLGDVEVAAGDLGKARECFEASLAIRDRLATREPGNAGWQRDLSVSYERLGDVEVAAGDLGKARDRFEARLAIADRLATREPGNAGWQRDLFVSHFKLAVVAEAGGDRAGALAACRRAEAVMAALVVRWPQHPGFARDLAQVRGEIARLGG